MKFNLFAYSNELNRFQVEEFSFNKGKNPAIFHHGEYVCQSRQRIFHPFSFFSKHFNKMADKINEESVHLHECEAVAQAIV